MPWTLYRYILRELLKLLVLSTGVLVLLISFVAAIKPLSEGLLGAESLPQFIGFTSPTMLIYALPFGGALASTLVFLRLASDNEILACTASGMSYRMVLLPVAALGLVLMMGLFALSNLVLPHMFMAASQTIEADVMTRLVTQLNQNRPFDRFGDVVLYADGAEQRPAPHLEDSARQPEQWIQLQGVAVAWPDREGRLRRDVTAEHANVLLYRGDAGESWITIGLRNVMYHDPQRGELAFTESQGLRPLRVPNPFLGRPKYFSWFRLREVNRDPDSYQPVRELRRGLAEALATAELEQALRSALGPGSSEHRLTLLGPREGERYTFHAPAMERDDEAVLLVADDRQPATVMYQSPHRSARRFEVQRVRLRVEIPEAGIEPTVSVQLHEARVYDPRLPGEFTERAELALSRLRWPEALTAQLLERYDAWAMLGLARSEPRYAQAPRVEGRAELLHTQLLRLARSIVSRLHERGASAVACLLLVVLGAVMSMQMRHQMPLVVFFWSFLLAILTLLLINVGESMASSTHFPLYAGLGLLWSGNVILLSVIAGIYCRLARN